MLFLSGKWVVVMHIPRGVTDSGVVNNSAPPSCQGPTVHCCVFQQSAGHKVAPAQHRRFSWINVRTSPNSIHHRQLYQKGVRNPSPQMGGLLLDTVAIRISQGSRWTEVDKILGSPKSDASLTFDAGRWAQSRLGWSSDLRIQHPLVGIEKPSSMGDLQDPI